VTAGAGARLRRLELVTISELFSKIYGSTPMRVVASLLFTTSLFLILVAQATAARKFFTALGLESPLVFLGCWGIMIFYTALGGLKAVIATDILQGIVKLCSLGLLWFAASSSGLSLPPLAVAPSLMQTPWVDWLVMPLLFMLIAQDMGQRCFAAKSPQTVTKAAIASALVFALVSIVPVYFGVRARAEGILIPAGTAVFIAAAQAFTNPYASALCAIGVLMALISIANSLLCSISSQVSYDLPLLQRGEFGRSARSAQWVTAVLGILAAGCSYAFTSVIPLLVLSYEVSVAVLFVPIFAVIINRPLSRQAAWWSMGLGAFGYGLATIAALPLAKALLALACSALPVLWVKVGELQNKRCGAREW
jgi:SSS family solute:Na+ symporter